MASPSAPELRVGLLGPLRVVADGTEAELGAARARAVFAVLAANQGRILSRQEIIAAVWGESPPASVAGNIYTYVSGLRRGLGAAATALVSQPAGYSLVLPADAVDATRFEQLCEQAEQLVADGDGRGAVARFDEALGLWRGEPYSGVPGPFAERERDRLTERRLAVLERRAGVLLDLGEHGELVADLTSLVREHPLRESLRVLFMIALYRAGRAADALEAFHDARRTLRDELGVGPGAELAATHERVLAGDPSLGPAPTPEPTRAAAAVPAALLDTDPGRLVGQDGPAGLIRSLVTELAGGAGRSLWIEGPAGIGKTRLLRTALAQAPALGCTVAWATADPLGSRFPLQVMVECLGIDITSPDPRRVALARQLTDRHGDRGPHGMDPVFAMVEAILTLVDELCAEAPLVLVVDDIQWADEASLLVWHRLAAASRQLCLLVVAAARPVSRRIDLNRLRHGVETRGHPTIEVPPLDSDDARRLVADLVGAQPGPRLRELAERAAGNPLYLEVAVTALLRSGEVTVTDGTAELAVGTDWHAPATLVAAVDRTLAELSEQTRQMLRWAALLGTDIAVTDLSAAMRCSVSVVAPLVEEAVAANVLLDRGTALDFRHPLLRQALYDAIPGPLRSALHRQAADALAGVGSPVRRVAEQLLAASSMADPWVSQWLLDHGAQLLDQAPLVAADLLRQVLASRSLSRDDRAAHLAALVRVLFRLNRNPETEARQAIALARDPALAAEMRQLLAEMLNRRGESDWAEELLDDALADPELPPSWHVHHRALLANVRRGDMADLDATEAWARTTHAEARESGDVHAQAYALQTLWHINSVRRDHATALANVDDALAAVTDDPQLAYLRFDLLGNRIFSLQNLDRLHEAGVALKSAYQITGGHSLPSGLQVTAAVHAYWEGRWDDALVELDQITEDQLAVEYHGLREWGPAILLLHGVAALIAGRRDDRDAAELQFAAAESYQPATRMERETYDFLLVAQALAAEREGDPRRALDLLAPILTMSYARMMLRHQWLPDVVRLATSFGDRSIVAQALDVCEQEARQEVVPARAFAALHRCRALADDDIDAGQVAAEHYARVGRYVELAAVLEDMAESHARAGRTEDALNMLAAAVDLYTELGARWDVRRAQQRVGRFGVLVNPAAAAPRPMSGWGALSPLEVRIAALVARGLSNPEITAELPLPRRTVQAHVTRILAKLGLNSRAEMAEQFASGLPK